MLDTSALPTSQRLVSVLETFSRGAATVEELEYTVELLIATSEEETAVLGRNELVATLVEVLEGIEFLNTAQVLAVAEEAATVLLGNVSKSDGDEESHSNEGNRLRKKRLETQFAIGSDCLAVLEEDKAWHPARIRKHIGERDSNTEAASGDDGRLIHLEVEFLEFGKRQIVHETDVVLDENVADREEADDMKGRCAMCERPMNLTAHHVIPRVTHSKYLRKGYTKEFLNTCILICRQCHSKIHSVEDNVTLAREYNTLDKIMQHPQIIAWVAFARKQKARITPQKQNKWLVRK
uniref:Tudor domain-containing protein n=1 Tax=Hyaloperonospora arabidopsidis (strain Emoy2) TaxID=559515 RepID=M4B3N2_HYAAE